jgi:hypothetical protein
VQATAVYQVEQSVYYGRNTLFGFCSRVYFSWFRQKPLAHLRNGMFWLRGSQIRAVIASHTKTIVVFLFGRSFFDWYFMHG